MVNVSPSQSLNELPSADSPAPVNEKAQLSLREDTVTKLDILLYGLNFNPELTGIGKYSGEMTTWLAAKGHRIRVVTSPPYYPEWSIWPGYSKLGYSRATDVQYPGLEVVRCPLWVPRNVTAATRILHLLSFAITSGPALFWLAVRGKPSVIILVVPTLACAPAALIVGRLIGVPVWLHVQDFEIDAMYAMNIAASTKRSRRIVTAFESWLMRRFDRVSTISPNMVKRLGAKGVLEKKTVHFPNWVDVSAIAPIDRTRHGNSIRDSFGLPDDAIVILYAGNMGQKQGIELVLDAARILLSMPQLQFVLVGAGSSELQLKQYAADLSNVRWFPLQPAEHLNDLLNAAEIHVLPQREDAADLVMPSKLTGMLASGKPVIGTAGQETQLGIVLDACGVRVDAGDASALALAIQSLAERPEEGRRLGALGRQYALENLSHSAVLSSFENELVACARTGGARK